MSFVDDKRISSCLPLLYSGWNRCGHLYLNLEGSVFSRISMKNFLYLSGSIFEVFRFMVVNSKCIFTVTLLLFVFVFHGMLMYLSIYFCPVKLSVFNVLDYSQGSKLVLKACFLFWKLWRNLGRPPDSFSFQSSITHNLDCEFSWNSVLFLVEV